MTYQVRFTPRARADLRRLYAFFVERDLNAAERALQAITKAVKLLEEFPFTCRKAKSDNPLFREFVIPFGQSGYVALFEIESEFVTILAVRHQREDDFY